MDTDTTTETKEFFFPVSLIKLSVMSFVSFGLYEIWWLFKNWKFVQEHTGAMLSPVWRSWFGFFWIYPLLKEIRQAGEAHGLKESFPAGAIATAWIILTLLFKLPGAWALLSIFSFIPILYAQSYVNQLNRKNNCPINTRFTRGNYIGIVCGTSFLVLAVLGMLMPPSTP